MPDLVNQGSAFILKKLILDFCRFDLTDWEINF